MDRSSSDRQLGLFAATSVGVGAIVGGGILALAGAAFAATGPSAIIAFALNGFIAVLTALSLSEMASRFPESGGTYTFSRKVMSVNSAFSVGWVVWFASIVAGLLYALGFAHFLIVMVGSLLGERSPAFLGSSYLIPILAIATTWIIAALLIVKSGGGGNWINVAKIVVFMILVLAGLWAVMQQPAGDTKAAFQPFFSSGFSGLIQAMGYTFIALQGFDLVAAVGGEVRNPAKNIPRAMLASLAIALAIYLPLLFVITAVGTDGQSIASAASADPEGIIASAAKNYLGAFGYWLVVIAAVLAMFSALQANLFAASRIAFAMARDRTLPSILSRLNDSNNPLMAIVVTAAMITGLILVVPDVATAGAASSLIFLVTFALAHWIAILVRLRSGKKTPPFRTPFFPLVPVVGGVACLSLAIFQGFAVPAAGLIAGGWLGIGSLLFIWLFTNRAHIRDASASAHNPELLRLRGHSSLVLVPVANPDNAEALITLAGSLVPAGMGRVLLQNVIVAKDDWDPEIDPTPLERSRQVVNQLLTISTRQKIRTEALTTIATDPMNEIARVARLHQCQSIVMGLTKISDDVMTKEMERLLSEIPMDVLILRARKNWQLSTVNRILVPVSSRSGHPFLMASVLGSLTRDKKREITYLRIVAVGTSEHEKRREAIAIRKLAEDQMRHDAAVVIIESNNPAEAIVEHANRSDLLILGATRVGRRNRVFGAFTKQVSQMTDCPMIILNNRID